MPWLEAMLAAVVVLAADQLSKRHVLAQRRYAAAGSRAFFDIRCVINRRGALLRLPRSIRIWAFVICAAFAIVALTQEPFVHSIPGATGIGLALGGIAGNFVDLVRRGGVVDFIVVGPWPVFNIADVAIVCGFGLVFLAVS